MSMMRLRRTRLRYCLKKIPRVRHLRGTWMHRMFGEQLFSPDLWKPSRFSVACGFSTGLFWACMPMPFQMLPSGITAYLLRFNIPSAISVVWVTNPLTWPVILYWQYRLGLWLLGSPSPPILKMDELLNIATGVPGPLLLGCVVSGVIVASTTFALVNIFWSIVVERWWPSHSKSNSPPLQSPSSRSACSKENTDY